MYKEEVAIWRQVAKNRLKSALPLVILGVSALLAGSDPSYTAAERRYWAFQPRRAPAIPQFESAADRAWATQSPSPQIDSFILASLHKAGLKPAPPASRRTLIRRVYYDLTGLPPTPEAVEQFVHDPDPGRLGKARRSPAEHARVRRAVGTTLAGRGSLCRKRRLRVRYPPLRSMALSRLRHPFV